MLRRHTQQPAEGRAFKRLRAGQIDCYDFAPYVHGDEVRFAAACWMVEAQAN